MKRDGENQEDRPMSVCIYLVRPSPTAAKKAKGKPHQIESKLGSKGFFSGKGASSGAKRHRGAGGSYKGGVGEADRLRSRTLTCVDQR